MGGENCVGDYHQSQFFSQNRIFTNSVEKAENELYKTAITMSYKTKSDIETLHRLFPNIVLDTNSILRLNREIEKATYKALSPYVSVCIDEPDDESVQLMTEEEINSYHERCLVVYSKIKEHVQQKLARLIEEQTYYFRHAIMEEIKRLIAEADKIRTDNCNSSLSYSSEYWDSIYLYDICRITESECSRSFLTGGYYV